jgi:cytochrome P450 family 6
MRKYPVVTIILRKSTKDYKVPYSSLTLKEGSRIDIPVFAIHHDPDIYPEPHVFDPERFSKENRGKFSSGTFLPFGCGPRTCIGIIK